MGSAACAVVLRPSANACLAGIAMELDATCGSRRDLFKAWGPLLCTMSLSPRPAQGFSSELTDVGCYAATTGRMMSGIHMFSETI
jgi:hypothetical protein